VQLIADRFVRDDGGDVVDLASGARVLLNITAAGSTTDQLRWTLRCDFFRALQHRAIASLVDFGLTGETSRFDAWQCGPRWIGEVRSPRAMSERAHGFLRVAGRTVGSDGADLVCVGATGAVMVPGDGNGYPRGSDEPIGGAATIETCGLRLIPRPVVPALGEMFDCGGGRRPRISVLFGRRGAGKRMVIRELARLARTNGFVPVAASLVGWRYGDLLRDRSLFIVADRSQTGWTAILRAILQSPRPHVVLIASETEETALDSIGLPAIGADALAAAVYPRVSDPSLVRRIRRAAGRARGLPGRFARLLWPDEPPVRRSLPATTARRISRGLRAAEQATVYGSSDAVTEVLPITPTDAVWPAPRELAALRRRMDAALLLIRAGRHAPGIRQLRHAIGGLARRSAWSDAADGALTLASALLRRGRPRDAGAALAEARDYGGRAGRESVLIDAATLSGEAWIDLARLDEAEAVLAAGTTTARALGDSARVAAASIALARCMYWRGQYAHGASILAGIDTVVPPGHKHRYHLLAARIALGEGHVDKATSLAAAALGAAREDNDDVSAAAAYFCAALVRSTIGDFDAAERDVGASIDGARRAHDPVRVVRARLLQVDLDRRRGRTGVAATLLNRLRRIASTLPPLIRARSDLLANVVSDPRQGADEIVSRHMRASGLGALHLYVCGSRPAERARVPFESIAGEVVAIVHACQIADDEAVVLKDVCGRVREQIHAAAVAFVSGPVQRYVTLASDGLRMEPHIAERAIAAGITIAPHRHQDRVEAAVPVRYGGAPAGALCARWTLGSTYDLGRAAPVLEMAAAAAAPVVAGLLARRDAAVPAGIELLGVTRAMADLRAIVERAAAAPFAVLVDGASGSGKELVARAIHRLGPRRDRAFCTLNCAALPEDLVEAELFGHARGAFTGAIAERPGVFEEAHGGTLFLDEIGELSPRAQAKVLRVIQEGELRRVGENLSRRIDVRIVAATNRDLRHEVEAGRFRVDLLYRLDVIRVTVPPLRDRREDIAVLAEHFWRDATRRVSSRAVLGASTLAALARYDWPGNVRELQNVLAALAVRSPRRGVVPPTALPPQFAATSCPEGSRLTEARRTFEERFVRAALARTGGHRGRAAADLGLSRQGLTKLMTRLGISDDRAQP